MDCDDRDIFVYVLGCIDFPEVESGGDLIKKAFELEDLITIKGLLHGGIRSDSPIFTRHGHWVSERVISKVRVAREDVAHEDLSLSPFLEF
jgi:hypothetical protein